MALKGTEIVEKSNELNEIRMNGMTLQQLRFFSIYLAKINARNEKTRKVIFPIKDFQKIMDLGRLNMKHFQSVTNGLLCQVYNQPNDDGGYTGFTIFKECRVFRNDLEEWFVEIDASDRALPLMFNLRKRYFKYELWNALRLKSANQIAMYELLKQYENTGKLEISVAKLRERLDLTEEYPRWDRFKISVLNSCQQALRETTDISFTYERGKVGNGGKWLTIIFNIKKNIDYIDQLTLDEFIEFQEEPEPIEAEQKEAQYDEHLKFIAGACDYEFSNIEMQMISAAMTDVRGEKERFDFLREQYYKMLRRAEDENAPLYNRFKYFMGIIKNEVEK